MSKYKTEKTLYLVIFYSVWATLKNLSKPLSQETILEK